MRCEQIIRLAWLRQEALVRTVNMREVESSLSRLVEAVETGAEKEIIIARNGRPAAELVAIRPVKTGRRIGIAKGRFVVPDTIDADEAAIIALFSRGQPSEPAA